MRMGLDNKTKSDEQARTPGDSTTQNIETTDKTAVVELKSPDAQAPSEAALAGGRYALRSASKIPKKNSLVETANVGSLTVTEPPEEENDEPGSASKSAKRQRKSTSKFFAAPTPSPSKKITKSPRPPRGTVSALPFPTLSVPQFGLIQEKLAADPFRLIIAITFLVRTPGRVSVPVFYELMAKYPTPAALMDADPAEIAAMIKHLGLSVVRTAQIQKYARIWLENPPTRDVRYGVKNYPNQGDGRDVRAGEKLPPEDQDPRASAWEIGHMTQGPYAIDSWRIFCRDVLLGRAEDWDGKGREPEFQPEWMRVLPLDKELRAYLRWMWMREGWDWDPKTGERQPLGEELRRAVDDGRVRWDNTGALQIIDVDANADIMKEDEVVS